MDSEGFANTVRATETILKFNVSLMTEYLQCKYVPYVDREAFQRALEKLFLSSFSISINHQDQLAIRLNEFSVWVSNLEHVSDLTKKQLAKMVKDMHHFIATLKETVARKYSRLQTKAYDCFVEAGWDKAFQKWITKTSRHLILDTTKEETELSVKFEWLIGRGPSIHEQRYLLKVHESGFQFAGLIEELHSTLTKKIDKELNLAEEDEEMESFDFQKGFQKIDEIFNNVISLVEGKTENMIKAMLLQVFMDYKRDQMWNEATKKLRKNLNCHDPVAMKKVFDAIAELVNGNMKVEEFIGLVKESTTKKVLL